MMNLLLSPLLLLLRTVNAEANVCGLQYEPNNVIVQQIDSVNFGTSPLFYSVLNTANYGFAALPPYFFANINGNVLSATTDRPGVIISRHPYGLPTANGAVQVNSCFSFEAAIDTGTPLSPLGFDQDPYYASGVFGLITLDGPVSWQWLFQVTNTKIYAMYAASDSTSGDYYFRYLIPVADRLPDDVNQYSVTVFSDLSVSYRIDGREVLRISPPNTLIDDRFNTAPLPATFPYPLVIPTTLYLITGAYNLDPILDLENPTNLPRFVCQETLFRQCKQSLRNAYGSACQYASIGDYNNPTLNFTMSMEYQQISGLNYTLAEGCSLPAGCKPTPISCPDVKPERRRKPVNPLPTSITTRPTSTGTTTIPTPTRRGCACRG